MIFTVKKNEEVSLIKKSFNVVFVAMVLIAIMWSFLLAISDSLDFSFIGNFKDRIWQGFWMTLSLSLMSLVLSLILGVTAAVCQNSGILPLKYLALVYVKIIRGTPLIMQIYLFYYIIGTAWGVDNRFISGVIILSVFEGAYISEIIRGSLLGIDSIQIEAAKAVGFNKNQTIKHVIMPQLLARTVPALTGQFASIVKDSSLLSTIAVIELTQTMREISADNFKLFECYMFLGILYLCITMPLSLISDKLESRFDYEN
ncbi:MAG: amino acid ABC transporter permease [Anaerovoracaceae bacterium]